MENVVVEQGLALQKRFPCKSSFSVLKNQIVISLKFGHYNIINMLFPFLAFLKLQPIIL